MESYSSYQTGSTGREQDFQKLSQTIGSSIQKISQNGKISVQRGSVVPIRNKISFSNCVTQSSRSTLNTYVPICLQGHIVLCGHAKISPI